MSSLHFYKNIDTISKETVFKTNGALNPAAPLWLEAETTSGFVGDPEGTVSAAGACNVTFVSDPRDTGEPAVTFSTGESVSRGKVGVNVAVGVSEGGSTEVAVRCSIEVASGVSIRVVVGVAVSVSVGSSTRVAMGFSDEVAVGVSVGVAVKVSIGVAVRDAVGVVVGVIVGELVSSVTTGEQ
jgi:hypothetical protein